MIISIFDPRVIAAYLISIAIAAGAGYLYKAHRVRVENAAVEAAATTAQSTAEAAVAASDTTQLRSLQRTIAANNARIAALLRQIDAAKTEAVHARQNDVAPADCRLPDGVRDEINRALAAPGAADAVAEVPRRDR